VTIDYYHLELSLEKSLPEIYHRAINITSSLPCFIHSEYHHLLLFVICQNMNLKHVEKQRRCLHQWRGMTLASLSLIREWLLPYRACVAKLPSL